MNLRDLDLMLMSSKTILDELLPKDIGIISAEYIQGARAEVFTLETATKNKNCTITWTQKEPAPSDNDASK